MSDLVERIEATIHRIIGHWWNRRKRPEAPDLRAALDHIQALEADAQKLRAGVAELELDKDRLLEDLKINTVEVFNACEGCGAPLYDTDKYFVDTYGVAGCWHIFLDSGKAGNAPCFAYRVGKKDARADLTTASNSEDGDA